MKQLFAKPAIPVGLGLAVLALTALIIWKDSAALTKRGGDMPPTIDFTWSPAGRVNLKEMRGTLSIKDDHGIDFTTYRFTIVELDKTIDMPIPGLIGKDYESPVSLSLIADDPRLAGKDKVTIIIEVADDKGQKTSLTKVIEIKR